MIKDLRAEAELCNSIGEESFEYYALTFPTTILTLLDCMEQMRAALETCCGGERKDPYYDSYLVHQALSTYAKLGG